VMTGHASIESAVGCMRRGAFDYLEKPFPEEHRVCVTVRKAIERHRLVARNHDLERALRLHSGIPELVGRSQQICNLTRIIRSLRDSERHVLIEGETGTGKELVARALHATSRRSSGPFVPVDCGVLSEQAIEEALFGALAHDAPGTPDAGLLMGAKHGTLFLDHVADLPAGAQRKLAHWLSGRGADEGLMMARLDVRVIAASPCDLVASATEGGFDRDLCDRLLETRIEVPELAERVEDIPLLVQHFVEKHQALNERIRSIDHNALEAMMARSWPGNVRELENVVETAMIVSTGTTISKRDLRLETDHDPHSGFGDATGLPLCLDAYEKAALERALFESWGDAAAAARSLGIGRSTFYRKAGKHGLSLNGREAGTSRRAPASRVGITKPMG
jgi:DNA-binding NtrC family response regulator